ncbi:MAG: hypothetical protein COA57_05745 [Flavobacteriales bacterium]|nr:MAG: hypothetical protein COA57_05745 [Flavobacteriales bacterium]
MQVHKYGLTLSRLRQEDIELVRTKRNMSEVQHFMEYRETITPEMQQRWFETEVNNLHSYYFLVHYNGKPSGLVHGKNNDFEKKESEGGMFFWEDECIGSTVPVYCSVIMADLNFYILGFERSFAKILDNNKIAFHYNKMLGFVPYSELENSEIARLYVLTKDAYGQKMKVFREKIARITGDATPLSFNDIDFSRVSPAQREILYAGFPHSIQEQIDAKFAETGREISNE